MRSFSLQAFKRQLLKVWTMNWTRFGRTNLCVVVGLAIGIALAVSLNLWMVSAFSMQRFNPGYTLVGAVVVLILGQLAVLWPALKAPSIPPALATRSA